MKLLSLSHGERAVVKLLKEEGLFIPMSKSHFETKERVLVVCCPDGDHFARVMVKKFMEMYDKTGLVSFHPLTRHGGTLVLDEGSPLVRPGHTTDKDLIFEIGEAVEMGYTALCDINHLPCRKARKHRIPPIKVAESLIWAKKRIKEKEEIANVTVAGFLQVTDGEEAEYGYIPHNEFIRWEKERGGHRKIKEMATLL